MLHSITELFSTAKVCCFCPCPKFNTKKIASGRHKMQKISGIIE